MQGCRGHRLVWRFFCACVFLCVFASFTAGAAHAAGAESFLAFRDFLKPDSDEAYRKIYKTIEWTPEERAATLAQFNKIYRFAPGVLSRGALGGTIAVYLSNIPTMAKGGTQRIVLSKKVFRYPDYSIRVVFHETIHTADSYDRVSGSKEFRDIFGPKIKQARAMLLRDGLTPSAAAALPLNARRKRIERAIRDETGLPSAYAARNLAECLAEVVSFWLAPDYKYKPPAAAVALLTPFVSTRAAAAPIVVQYGQAEALVRTGKDALAIRKLTALVAKDPAFYQAFFLRGYLYSKTKKYDLAMPDLKRARDLVSPLQRSYGFYDSQWRRVQGLAIKPRP